MSRSLNKVLLIGNVGSEAEVRTTGGGQKVAKFSIATNRIWNDKNGQKQEKVEWHRVTAWGKLADIVEEYVHKGDRIYVDGSIEYSQTEGDGGVRYWTDINAREILLLGSREGGQQSQQHANKPQSEAAPAYTPTRSPFDVDDDDLPF